MKTASAIVLATLAVTGALAAVAGVGAGAAANANTNSVSSLQDDESNAYAGTHVAFEASGNALTDYRVGGAAVFDRVAVESKESHQGQAGIDADVGLDAVTDLEGLGLSIAAQSETRAEVQTEGSASLTAHDTDRGILTVDAGGEGQYVQVDLAGDAEASADGDRVVVRSGGDDGDENESESERRDGTFLVVGDGSVTVTDDGDVTADLEGDSTLVFRSYADGERDDDAKAQEDMIAEGTATAEVYVEERGGEFVQDVAIYGQDIAVEATERSEERVEMTVERADHEGTVVVATVSEAVASAEETSVTVDGEAAVEASSYSELEGAIGSDESRYMVTQESEASASADVLVAVNHFSERTVAIESADAEDGDSSDDSTTDDSSSHGDVDDSNSNDDADDSSDGSPGFGITAALVAALLAVGARARDDR